MTWKTPLPLISKSVPARCTALCMAFMLALVAIPALAADHGDAPLVKEDPAADIADLYAWHTDDGKLNLILTFAGAQMPTADQSGTYDTDVLYTVHVAYREDFGETPEKAAYDADYEIHIRFGENDSGDYGVQVMNLPGGGDALVGPVETSLVDGAGNTVWVGLTEEPFFFDLEGFQDTLATGTVKFNPERDFFAGKNCTAIAIQMDLDTALDGESNGYFWASTGRIGGE